MCFNVFAEYIGNYERTKQGTSVVELSITVFRLLSLGEMYETNFCNVIKIILSNTYLVVLTKKEEKIMASFGSIL